MGRLHKMEVAGLNIKIHPHPDGIYDDFILAIFGLKKITKIHGDRFGLITLVKQDADNPEFYDGVLSTFLKIEMSSEWFNTETMEEATSNDVREIKIPEYLHPNLKTFRFTFNTKRHEFVFQHYAEGLKLTHNSALNYMKNIVTENRIKGKFGDVKVGVINEKGSVDKIFSIPRITELEVYIERPNSDVWGVDFEEQAESHLGDKNARSMNVLYKSERGVGIVRDEDLDALVRASISNGHSVARGYGAAGHMEVRTDKFPKVEREMYPENVEPGTIFRRMARAFRR